MKRVIFLLLILIVITQVSATIISQDNFENGLNGWTLQNSEVSSIWYGTSDEIGRAHV